MFSLTLVLAVLVGLTLGLLGGGGSILTVPLLVYVAGQEPKTAIATSLLVVGVTSGVAVISHARSGRVRWRAGLLFGVAGMAGAYGGGRVAEYIPGTWLLVAFGLMMAATAVAMLRGSSGEDERQPHDDLPVARVLLDGLVVGLVTGLVGAGGGFLVVPALVLLGGLPMSAAIGTSLLVIAMKSSAGLLGYLHSVEIDWTLAAGVTAAAVAGTFVGERLAGRFSQDALRRIFGWFVVAMATVVLGQQLPSAIWGSIVASPITWAVVGAGASVVTAVALRVHPWRR